VDGHNVCVTHSASRTQLFLNFQFVGSMIQEALPTFQGQLHFMTESPFGNLPQAELEQHFFLSDV
jgi:hypothetical protein